MFRIITGVPGSGKSFYAVNYLRKFCTYDPLYKSMNLDSEVLLVTNIEDVKIQHISFDAFRENGLMNVENLKQFMIERRFKRCIMIVDEAQRHFSNLKNENELFFFEYHRHLGIDVFLVLQTVSALPRRVVELSEYVIEALPRSYAITGFRYKAKDSKTGQTLYSIMIKKDLTVFQLYKSFDVDEMEKPKAVVLRKYALGIAVVLGSLALAVYFLTSGPLGLHQPAHAQINTPTVPKVVKTVQTVQERPKVTRSYISQSEVKEKEKEEKKNIPSYVVITGNVDVYPNDVVKGYIKTKDKTYIINK